MKYLKYFENFKSDNDFIIFTGENKDECVDEVKNLISNFKKDYLKIGKKYKNSGIGDTSIDEDMVKYLYNTVHFKNISESKYENWKRDDGNDFALLLDDKEEIEKCTEEIKDLVWEFREKFLKLEDKYPGAGLQDTMTDDELSRYFFDVIHTGDLESMKNK